MSWKLVVLSAAVTTASLAVAVLGFGLSFARAVLLAPVFVLTVGLVVTVDCGITAADEVAAARAQGLEVVVTDHHRPGERLPDCPLVVTRPSEYPFPELCGTGVVFK